MNELSFDYKLINIIEPQKYQEQQRAYQANWPWSKAFDNEFIKEHQEARPNLKNDGDDSNASDFVEYSTEHLPVPQGLIQNYIKGKTAKKNSNQCKYLYYLLFCYFIFYLLFFSFLFLHILVAKATCKFKFFFLSFLTINYNVFLL